MNLIKSEYNHKNHTLKLTFSDGYVGEVNLEHFNNIVNIIQGVKDQQSNSPGCGFTGWKPVKPLDKINVDSTNKVN